MKNKTYFVKSINGGEAKIEGKTFEEAVQNNKHRLKHIDLQGRDFSKMDFSNAYLHTANLQKCNFIYSKLKQANLREADLTQATLCSADLRGANMFHCNLFTTNLVEADLRGARNENMYDYKLFIMTGMTAHRLKLAQDLLEMIKTELLGVFNRLEGSTELAHLRKTIDNVLKDIG